MEARIQESAIRQDLVGQDNVYEGYTVHVKETIHLLDNRNFNKSFVALKPYIVKAAWIGDPLSWKYLPPGSTRKRELRQVNY